MQMTGCGRCSDLPAARLWGRRGGAYRNCPGPSHTCPYLSHLRDNSHPRPWGQRRPLRPVKHVGAGPGPQRTRASLPVSARSGWGEDGVAVEAAWPKLRRYQHRAQNQGGAGGPAPVKGGPTGPTLTCLASTLSIFQHQGTRWTHSWCLLLAGPAGSPWSEEEVPQSQPGILLRPLPTPRPSPGPPWLPSPLPAHWGPASQFQDCSTDTSKGQGQALLQKADHICSLPSPHPSQPMAAQGRDHISPSIPSPGLLPH